MSLNSSQSLKHGRQTRRLPCFVTAAAAALTVFTHLDSSSPLSAQTTSPALLDAGTAVERLGNPFAAQFPDGESAYARNVWDMQVFDDRLYLGYGNSNNAPPAPNAGPLDVWSYLFETQAFSAEYRIDEEQIDRYIVQNQQLIIPGHDPAAGEGNVSSIYTLEDRDWAQHRALAGVIHIYDLIQFGERWFAAVAAQGTTSAVQMLAEQEITDAAWVSFPLVTTPLLPSVAFEFLPVGDQLYLFASKLRFIAENGQPVAIGDVLYHLEGDSFQSLPLDPFAGQPEGRAADAIQRAVRTVVFHQRAVYIGAFAQADGHQWTPFALFSLSADERDPLSPVAAPRVTAHPLPAPAPDGDQGLDPMLPRDLRVDGDVLYVLASASNRERETMITRVLATCDLLEWSEIVRFEAPTFARSFELYDGMFYFGLGSEADAISPATGDILRTVPPGALPTCDGGAG